MKMTMAITTAVFAAVMITTSLHAATVDEVIVRQQWPWSTDVKVEYRITGVTDPVNISVAAYDGDTPLDSSKLAASMKGDLYGIMKDTYGSFTIDVTNAFGTASLAIMNFNVRLSLTPSSANMTDVLYKVVDLDSGAVTDITRADFYGNKYGSFTTNFSDFVANGKPMTTYFDDVLIWTDVTNNPIYKTDKLVLRKIPAASWGPWLMDAPGSGGSSQTGLANNQSNAVRLVQLTSDYYAGVFPVTQAQYFKVCNKYSGNDNCFTNGDIYADHLLKPTSGASWTNARGGADAVNGAPSSASFCGRLNAKPGIVAAGITFDLPTEAQWEFAARGGVTNNAMYYIDADVTQKGDWLAIVWSSHNAGNQYTGYDSAQTVAVGRLPPNGFGLYDTLGNVFEWVRDYSNDSIYPAPTAVPEINPMGIAAADAASTSNGKKHILRGGSFNKTYTYCSLRTRYNKGQNAAEYDSSFRVICTVP